MFPSHPSAGASEPQRAGSKRAFETVFASSAHTQPLHNGMRPSSAHNSAGVKLDNEELGPLDMGMEYRRADGEIQKRAVPEFQ
ncbi:hypothetical protein V493_07875 [Pseudogymnoascus sp. VKM F-4281 (FW-2241)]|nr:hypothetical protein V493_07875 [Pseudogymnoascus sp. VKM F-4281 (FW-2241)]